MYQLNNAAEQDGTKAAGGMKLVSDEAAATEGILLIRQKHRDVILLELYLNQGILHSVLACRVGLSMSGLNATIKKINSGEDKPISERKSGKFKYYFLAESGKKYVEEVLLNPIVEDVEDEKAMREITLHITTFKDCCKENWPSKIRECIISDAGTVGEKQEEVEVFHDFIQAFAAFYCRKKENAEKLLELLINQKELSAMMVEYILRNTGRVKPFELIDRLIREDCPKAYALADGIFEDIEGTNMENLFIDDKLQPAADRLKAELLKAVIRGWGKQELTDALRANGLDMQFAFYVSEKYLHMLNNYKQSIDDSKAAG